MRTQTRNHIMPYRGTENLYYMLEASRKIGQIEESRILIKEEMRLDYSEGNISDSMKLKYQNLDFVRTFREMIIGICKSKNEIRNLIGMFFRDLMYNSERVETLRYIIRLNQEKYRKSNFWIPPEFKSELRRLLYGKTRKSGDFIKNMRDFDWRERMHRVKKDLHIDILGSWVYFHNISESDVYGKLVPDAFSYLTKRRIACCLAMKALFTHLLSDYFEPLPLSSCIVGNSGLPRYFDGYFAFGESENTAREVYLVKFSVLRRSSSTILINDFCTMIQDVQGRLDVEAGGILFVPGYPTPDTLKTELYWKDYKRVELTVLYLADFYELFRIWDTKTVVRFLLERMK